MTVRNGVAKLSILEKIQEYNNLIEQNNLSIIHVKMMLEDLKMGDSFDECKRNSKKLRPTSVPARSSSKMVDRMLNLFNV